MATVFDHVFPRVVGASILNESLQGGFFLGTNGIFFICPVVIDGISATGIAIAGITTHGIDERIAREGACL
jgi:hypothetical protein